MSVERLATYGTPAPGRSSHHQVAELGRTWSVGMVRGRLIAHGGGASLGYLALVLDRED